MLQKVPEATATDTYLCLTVLVLLKIDSGDFIEAEVYCKNLLAESERAFGPEHPLTGFCLYYLATIYMKRGMFDQAEPLLTSAMTINQSTSFPQNVPTPQILMSLAKLRSHQENPTEAQTLYAQALMLAEQLYGPEHPRVADVLTEWAIHYSSHGEPRKAEELRKEATAIYTKSLASDHPDVVNALSGLSAQYFTQNRYAEADEYYDQARKMWKSKYHTRTSDKEVLESISHAWGEISTKEANLQHFLDILDTAELGEGEDIATVSTRLANSCLEQGQYQEAQEIFWHALEVSEQTRGEKDLVTMYCLGNLARFYQICKEYVVAEFFYERTLQLASAEFRFRPTGTLHILENYIEFLGETGRESHRAEMQRHLEVLKNLKD